MATTRVTFEFLKYVLDLPEEIEITELEVTEMDDEHKVITLHLQGDELEDTEHSLQYEQMFIDGIPAGVELVNIEPVNTESS